MSEDIAKKTVKNRKDFQVTVQNQDGGDEPSLDADEFIYLMHGGNKWSKTTMKRLDRAIYDSFCERSTSGSEQFLWIDYKSANLPQKKQPTSMEKKLLEKMKATLLLTVSRSKKNFLGSMDVINQIVGPGPVHRTGITF
ncbi:hypothetical protein H5410_040255 [Solanum commersonii]|uniref:Uncharacterized protein n=1 Tax=Solanum commersonii TaxID=4109 RepID=A0A9J5XPK5_SOLCO|nr:hypothetical protein H5410_040255 [Solanum commersonii]